MDWFLYDNDPRHERVKESQSIKKEATVIVDHRYRSKKKVSGIKYMVKNQRDKILVPGIGCIRFLLKKKQKFTDSNILENQVHFYRPFSSHTFFLVPCSFLKKMSSLLHVSFHLDLFISQKSKWIFLTHLKD